MSTLARVRSILQILSLIGAGALATFIISSVVGVLESTSVDITQMSVLMVVALLAGLKR